jgi:hypothetical protein
MPAITKRVTRLSGGRELTAGPEAAAARLRKALGGPG